METVLGQRWPIATDLATGALFAFDHAAFTSPSIRAGAGGGDTFSSAYRQATDIEFGLQPAQRLADECRYWPVSWRQPDGDDILD